MLTYALQGYSTFSGVDDDHHVALIVNGEFLCDIVFDGYETATGSVSIPADVLRAKDNELAVRVYGDAGGSYDSVYMNFFEVTFYRAMATQVNESVIVTTSSEGALSVYLRIDLRFIIVSIRGLFIIV